MDVFHNFVTYVVPYLNFLIFLFIVAFFSKKPLSQVAKSRRTDFEKHLQEASKTLENAKQQLQEVQMRRKNLGKELAEMREHAEASAKEEAKAIVEEGRKQANYLMEEARRIRDIEYLQAQKKLEAEAIAKVRVKLIERLQQNFDQDVDERFIKAQIKDIRNLAKDYSVEEVVHV